MPETTVHRLLAAVEELAPMSSGAFVIEVDDERVGSVFVERNEVCWAAYTGLNRRLRNLLRENLAAALGKEESMRRALKQHTLESLLSFPQEQGERFDWIEHRQNGYQPRFTFRPAELLVGVNAMLYATEAAGADMALKMFDAEARAATFVPADGGGLVAIRMHGPATIAELDELGGWAEAVFGVTRGFSREVNKRVLEGATGELCVAWQTSHVHTHAAVLEHGSALATLVAELEGKSLPTVISRRALRSVERNP